MVHRYFVKVCHHGSDLCIVTPPRRLMTAVTCIVVLAAGCQSPFAADTPHVTPPTVAATTSGTGLPVTTARTPSVPTPATAIPQPVVPPPTSTPPAGPELVQTGEFELDLAPEASGIAVGRRDPAVWWIVSDEPGTSAVVAVDATGSTQGQITMQGTSAVNLEDIAVGPCAAEDLSPCVFVADIGDNAAGRIDILIHRFPEPTPETSSTPVTTITLRYPDGPIDAEALVVDQAGRPFILTKERGLSRVYAPAGFADGSLSLVATLAIPPPAAPLLTNATGLSVTGADLSPDGQRLLLRTYDSVVELTPTAGASPLSDLAEWTPEELPAPFEPQGEAVAYLPDGRSFVTVSEGSGAIWTLQR